MIKRNLKVMRLLYFVRDLRAKQLFKILRKYCGKDILDVGGGAFYPKIKDRLTFSNWTSLESSEKYAYKTNDGKYHLVFGDGCDMKFKNESFDTILCIQVLEHVYEPNKMFSEIARVLKPDGHAIFMVPQTANTHLVPDHYYNFTKYWIRKSAKLNNLKVVEMIPMGGFWSSAASRLFIFFLQSIRYEVVSDGEERRNFLFYFLLPLMWFYAVINIPICLIFAFSDLNEEPNNHLLVLKK